MKATLALVVFSVMSGANSTAGGSTYERLRAYAEKPYDSIAACQKDLPAIFRDAQLYYMNPMTDPGTGDKVSETKPTSHLLAIDLNFRISADCYEGGPRLETIALPSAESAVPQAAPDVVVSRCEATGCTSYEPMTPWQSSHR